MPRKSEVVPQREAACRSAGAASRGTSEQKPSRKEAALRGTHSQHPQTQGKRSARFFCAKGSCHEYMAHQRLKTRSGFRCSRAAPAWVRRHSAELTYHDFTSHSRRRPQLARHRPRASCSCVIVGRWLPNMHTPIYVYIHVSVCGDPGTQCVYIFATPCGKRSGSGE